MVVKTFTGGELGWETLGAGGQGVPGAAVSPVLEKYGNNGNLSIMGLSDFC